MCSNLSLSFGKLTRLFLLSLFSKVHIVSRIATPAKLQYSVNHLNLMWYGLTSMSGEVAVNLWYEAPVTIHNEEICCDIWIQKDRRQFEYTSVKDHCRLISLLVFYHPSISSVGDCADKMTADRPGLCASTAFESAHFMLLESSNVISSALTWLETVLSPLLSSQHSCGICLFPGHLPECQPHDSAFFSLFTTLQISD